jgi:hypothetical protein
MMGHDAVSRLYHVFRNGACYEFQLGIYENPQMSSEDELEDTFSELKDVLATVTIASRSTLRMQQRRSTRISTPAISKWDNRPQIKTALGLLRAHVSLQPNPKIAYL